MKSPDASAATPPAELGPAEYRWSIALYRGASPLELRPVDEETPVVLAAEQVRDVQADFVADPFCLRWNGRYQLFFEVWNRARSCGEIALATSSDLRRWSYDRVVLRENFHLSYPCVFATPESVPAAERGIYMLPETRAAQAVRLYRAEAFPHRWRLEREILRGDFADATPFHHQGRWWIFAHRGLDELRLYSSPSLCAEFHEHPRSPLVAGNRRVSRPAGRVVRSGGRILRFAQDAWPNYGSRVRALEIEILTPDAYRERELEESPILEGSGEGWNALGMHHIELLSAAGDSCLALVDGYTPGVFAARGEGGF